MISFLKRFWDTRVDPVTSQDVEPAGRNVDKEMELRSAVAALVTAKWNSERRSIEIRRQLAGNVLKLVSGD